MLEITNNWRRKTRGKLLGGLFKGSKVSRYGTLTLLRQENVQIYEVWHDLAPSISLSLRERCGWYSRQKAGHSGVTHCYFPSPLHLPSTQLLPSSSSCLPLLVIPTSGFNLIWDYRRKRCINNNPLNPWPAFYVLLLISRQSWMTDLV